MRCSAGVLCMRYPGCRITGTVVRACLIQLNFASHHPQASFNWLVTLCARRPRRAASYEHGACQQDNAGLLILCICRLCTVVGATGAALAELCAGHEIHFTGWQPCCVQMTRRCSAGFPCKRYLGCRITGTVVPASPNTTVCIRHL
ncbi:hypothetical protein D9Q98_006325 [Chlorella vulgaris]|uniref:Uncharacterized protein n=1 Tax=Chlorella vulgaris TaxID=3077 RepID=A0A9D4YV35_CHLVU|nr:hypothetical protein D9Q98_006325 [Chlorella vulgaris]